jgi:multidrug efflux pump subunit AcrA (membrane-fusion protein)
VERRRVQTGTTQGVQVEITQGLADGEPIVASGVAFLADGQHVNRRAAP